MGGEKTNRIGRRRSALMPRQLVAIWGALTVAAAVDLLDRSFRLTPLDPQAWDERDRLALDNWSSLPEDLRQKVTNEVALSAPVMPARAATLRAGLNGLHDPSGRAVGLAILK